MDELLEIIQYSSGFIGHHPKCKGLHSLNCNCHYLVIIIQCLTMAGWAFLLLSFPLPLIVERYTGPTRNERKITMHSMQKKLHRDTNTIPRDMRKDEADVSHTPTSTVLLWSDDIATSKVKMKCLFQPTLYRQLTLNLMNWSSVCCH